MPAARKDGGSAGAGASPDDLLRLAVAAHRAGRLDKAAAGYHAVLFQRPDDIQALNFLGLLEIQRGRLDAAESAIDRALDRRPDYADALYNRGMIRKLRGDPEGAAAALRRSLALKPGQAQAFNSLGVVLDELGRPAEAIAAYEDALRLWPDYTDALNNLGVALGAQGRSEDAISLFGRALVRAPASAEILNNRGVALRAAGRGAEACADFAAAVAADRGHVAARENLIMAHIEAGAPGEALAVCDAALAVRPYDVHALALKSLALAEAGGGAALEALADVDRLAGRHAMDPRPAYPSIAALNADLRRHIENHPTLERDPGDHATRHGWHTGELADDDAKPVAVLRGIIDGAVAERVATLPDAPDHPFVAAKPAAWRLTLWAVVMESQGHQVPHIHSSGWVSGVCYVALPPTMGAGGDDRAGWIEFGAGPAHLGLTRTPPTEAFRPEEGVLFTFPSYFWHRTIPFVSEEPRICVAFDAMPVEA